MSYDYDSSKLQETRATRYQTEANKTAAENDVTSLNVFQKTLPSSSEEVNEKLANLDVNDLVKKYKKNPIGVLNELGIEFTDKEKAELETIITNKKELKSFLNLIKENQSLKPGDILGAMRNIKEYAPKGLFSRIGNVVKTAFTEGLSEAIDLAKSETVHYAGKLGKNMNEVRSERSDFSSDAVVNVSETVTKEPEVKDDVMHFVVKSNKDGSKLYTETDVLKAQNIIIENIDDAKEFTANAVELESIQDNNGNIKYKGSTIIDVDEKMINNKEVKSTMMNVAKKKDMTDNFLLETTSNLAKNHDMAEAIDFLTNAKDKDGKDRFSAENVYTESNYLNNKAKKFCDEYVKEIKNYSKYNKLNADSILTLTHNTTEHPEIKNEVLKKLNNSNMSGEEIANYSTELVNSANKQTSNSNIKNQHNDFNRSYERTAQEPKTAAAETVQEQASHNDLYDRNNVPAQLNKPIRTTNVISNPIIQIPASEGETVIQKAVIDGNVYERSVVLRELSKKYGASAEKVLNAIEKDASFIDLMKQYNGNQTIVNALVEDPYLITKIKKSNASLSINELADIVKLCTDNASTEVMLEALQSNSPQEAMRITKKSKIFNLKDDTLAILSSTNGSSSNKKSELEELYLTGGKKREIIG